MQDANDRPTEPEIQDRKGRRITAILAVAVLAGTILFAFYGRQEEPEVAPEPQLKEGWYDEVLSHLPPETATTDDADEDSEPAPVVIELPTLDDSDPLVIDNIPRLNPSHQLLPWLGSEHIIRRGVTVANGLGEGIIHGKLLNIPAPKGQFRADKTGQRYQISPDNYQRYEYLVNVISSIDSDQLAETYQLLHPLLETAYSELGVPGHTFDEVVVSAIDQILSAPKLDAPAELKLTSVTYTFADPALEALPPVQKLLIRMGPENARKVQQAAMAIRTKMLSNGGALGQKPAQ